MITVRHVKTQGLYRVLMNSRSSKRRRSRLSYTSHWPTGKYGCVRMMNSTTDDSSPQTGVTRRSNGFAVPSSGRSVQTEHFLLEGRATERTGGVLNLANARG